MPHRKIRVNDGFGVSKVATSTQEKKEYIYTSSIVEIT